MIPLRDMRGAVLLICLLLLMALGVVALAATSDSQVQEQVSSHVLDTHQRSQSGQAALAWAEAWLMSLPGDQRPDPACVVACTGPRPVREQGFLGHDFDRRDDAWWEEQAYETGLQPGNATLLAAYELPAPFRGQWLIEEARFEAGPQALEGLSGIGWYRVAARGTAVNGARHSYFESIVARPWGEPAWQDSITRSAAEASFCDALPSSIPCGRAAWQQKR